MLDVHNILVYLTLFPVSSHSYKQLDTPVTEVRGTYTQDLRIRDTKTPQDGLNLENTMINYDR